MVDGVQQFDAQSPTSPPVPPVNKFFDSSQAFALPEGTVRATIALMVLGADIFMQCWYKWAPPTLDTMATVAFTFYFAQGLTRPKGGPNA